MARSCGLARAKGSGRLVPAVNQTVADHRDRREHRERNGIPREVAARGKRQRGAGDRSTIVSSPARPLPQCVATATAANTGANGAMENNGHVTRVRATLVSVTRTARP